MGTKHTPGPWHVGGRDKCTIYDQFQQRVANSFEGVMVAHRSDTECVANARLIAAAPRMLAALRRAALALAFAAEESAAMQDDYEAVSAAISEATGASNGN